MLSHEEYKNTRKKLSIKKGTNKPLTIEEIIEFENKNKIKIPKQYKKFLLENNGAEPVINQIEMINGNPDSDYFGINCFVQLKYAEVGDTLDNYDEENNNVKPPKGLMNIAYLDGDHPELFICVEKGKNYGKIFFCVDREPSSIELIRENFNELLENILPYNDYEFEEYCDCGNIEKAKELILNGYQYPENAYKTMIDHANQSDYDMTEVLEALFNRENIIKNEITKVYDNPELLRLLINKGSNINEIDENGNSPLINTIKFHSYIIRENEIENKIKSIKILLENGADIKIRNNEGLDVFGVLNQEKEYWGAVSLAFTPEEEQEEINIKNLKNDSINKMIELIKNYAA